MGTNADIFRGVERACDRDDEKAAIVREKVDFLIRSAVWLIEQNRPHTAATRLEEAAQTLRLTARAQREG
jgi:hypothetical protein